MSDTPTEEAVQVPGTPCITITKFPSAFAHARTPFAPAARLRSRPRLWPPVAGTRPPPHAHVRAGHLEMRARSPRAAPRSRGNRHIFLQRCPGFPAERGFAAGERPGKAERPGWGPARPRSPACGAAPRARGSRGGHGHRLCWGYNWRDTRPLPQMHTSSPKSPFELLIVLQICPYLYITSLSTFVRKERKVFLERHTFMCLHGSIFSKAHRTSMQMFCTTGSIYNKMGVISKFTPKD